MENLKIRELEQNDLFNGFLESLNSLRNTSNIDKEKAENWLKKGAVPTETVKRLLKSISAN